MACAVFSAVGFQHSCERRVTQCTGLLLMQGLGRQDSYTAIHRLLLRLEPAIIRFGDSLPLRSAALTSHICLLFLIFKNVGWGSLFLLCSFLLR